MTDGAERPEARRWRPRLRTALEWVVVLAVALAIALLVRTYVVQTYFIPSGSMEPTLQVGDRILVLKFAYRLTSPKIGDVVVFKAPPKERSQCDSPEIHDLVKRIVGLPGDTIVSHGNSIFVNGHVLNQTWPHVAYISPPITFERIPKNHYFMMGDNHPNSCDSRSWGTLPRSDFIGKAVLIYWPLSRFSIL